MLSTRLLKMKEAFSNCWEVEWFLRAISLPFPMLNAGSWKTWGPHKLQLSQNAQLSLSAIPCHRTSLGKRLVPRKGLMWYIWQTNRAGKERTRRNMDAVCPKTIPLRSFLPQEKLNLLFCEDWQNSCAFLGILLPLVAECYPSDQIPRGAGGVWPIRLFTRFYWAIISPVTENMTSKSS